ncbi:MAG: DinB family protein [Candidatus Eisenbacteria bacterium]|uniref:DinB family protein n=1 Tax=Eiseniibacteriota bacterium TaxID=2212470 RepID=A0A933W8I4_UNCEI|nr:DinB family protein [Candidatus Eisenbacteria bacterium]
MPHLDDAIRYAEDPNTGEPELRRACEILGIAADGEREALRERLRAHLDTLQAQRPVVCLNPGPLARRSVRAGPAVPRPGTDEHSEVFAAEIALVPDVPDFAAMLAAQLDVTKALVATFGEAHAGMRYAGDKWSVREVIGHLADCERVLSYRLLRALRADATPLPGFDANAYVVEAKFESRTLAEVMAEFAAVRAGTVALVLGAEPEQFAFRLPVGKGSITGRALAYLIAGHERHHQQLLRERYLVVLPDAGGREGGTGGR